MKRKREERDRMYDNNFNMEDDEEYVPPPGRNIFDK